MPILAAGEPGRFNCTFVAVGSTSAHSIREGDEAFRDRADKAACTAKILVDAALENLDIKDYIADPNLQNTVEHERRNPTVRIDYDEAFAVCGIGEGLQATKNKHWGQGPRILPLRPEDPVDPVHVLYVFKEGSRYNMRFEQRKRMKELLGKKYRPLVQMAKGFTQTIFLEQLTSQQAYAIRCILQMDPITFWRAAKGRIFYELPQQPGRIDPGELAAIGDKPKQLGLAFERPRTREDFASDRRST